MTESEFRDGCPISTTLLETTPQSASIRAAGVAAFASWAQVFSDSLLANGVAQPRAGSLASLAVAVIQGALLQARVEMSAQPLTQAADEVAIAFSQAMAIHNQVDPSS